MSFEPRSLGRSGLRISPLVFGTMSFGGDADADASERMYQRCREAGIDTFDCANVYSGGEAERLLGRFCEHERDEVVLTTKAYFPTGRGPNDWGAGRLHLTRALERSLERLRTDYVDVFFIHRWDTETPIEETVTAVGDLIRAGKTRYWGVSNFSAWQMMKACAVADALGVPRPICAQPMYNLVKRQAEVEILEAARAEGIGVVPYSPLGAGLLTGKYRGGAKPSDARLSENEIYQSRYGEASYVEAAERFVAIADELELHPATLAVAWVAAHPAVSAPIIGARHVGQLDAVLRAPDVNMTSELYDRIAAVSATPPPATDRSEERAGYDYAKQTKR